ncbi:hypothetical protein AC578_5909 [Pseudocercospora eumusae]|uniref:Uncharacterized protein n=1 Tax=Pseudocercospora eumusae TaxID=321146 RepID=A0A139HBG9_9PEZI|nr:hypothetical protein AC578_5909 [Pseudocercospora eumusae]
MIMSDRATANLFAIDIEVEVVHLIAEVDVLNGTKIRAVSTVIGSRPTKELEVVGIEIDRQVGGSNGPAEPE